MGITTDLIYIVLAALIGGSFAHLIKMPLIFGYLLAGVIVGPYTGGVTVENIHDIEMLAEIGVALLLFTIGLEFSFKDLKRLSKVTLIGTPLQIIISALIGYFVASRIGFSEIDAIWIGGAISLSSTMVVIKTLNVNNSVETPAGRIMLAVLIAQDLAVIPLILLLPQLTQDSINYYLILEAVIKSVSFLILMYFAGTKIFPKFFSFISKQGSRELFFLTVLGLAFGSGFISHELGLSFALGAFVAGMLLSETDFSHQALSDITSLRDLFALIFFVSIGMLFDPDFFFEHFTTITALVITIVSSKALILGLIIKFLGYDMKIALTVALGLSQVGEFAFVIINTGSRLKSLSIESFSLMISVTLVSMIATPALFRISNLILKMHNDKNSNELNQNFKSSSMMSEHVIILGGGVVGQYVANVLSKLARPYIIIESNHKAVKQMQDQNINVLFGDGSKQIILEVAGIKNANLVVVTTTNDKNLPLIVQEIKELRADIPIVVRVQEIGSLTTLHSLSVHEIVQPQLEVGLEMVRQSLFALKCNEEEIFKAISELRERHYNEYQKRN